MKREALRVRRKPRAATSDVLGSAESPHIPGRWRKHYRMLLALRDLLLNRKDEQTRDTLEERPSFSSHMADAATDTFDRDFALGMLSSEQDALYEINEALDRICQGTYGTCELTGRKIERERLEAIPWTRFCVAAERQLEKEKVVNRAHLGPRSTVIRAEAISSDAEEEG